MRSIAVGRHPVGRDARGAGAAILKRDDQDNVLRFKRRSIPVRRSRRSPLVQWLAPLAAALAIVALPTGIVTWVMTSPRFALAEVTVVTGERVSEEWVRESLRPFYGDNLPLLPLATAEGLLRRHPWVRSADLRKDLPAGLAVRLREKRAVALLRDAQDLYYLDEEGVRIERFDPLLGSTDLLLVGRTQTRAGDPVPEAASLRAAVRLADEFEGVQPAWSAGLSEIEILGDRDFQIHTTGLPFPLLVRAGTLERKARRLEELLPHITERFGAAAAIDLRFARRIIVQPSVGNGDGRRRAAPATEQPEAKSHAQRG